MTEIAFHTQRPREDGCGVVTLQMLTGKPYDEIADLFDWTGKSHHQTNWNELRPALAGLGWQLGEITAVAGWDDIRSLAIVHVMDDHFMLYDGRSGVFYDPWEWEGPQQTSNRAPLSFVTVAPPQA
ncbi:MAG: hypothetical protein ACO1O4_10895 [Devosia sp.]